MENVLEIHNVSKHFGHFTALDDVSLNIKRGEIYGLIGENGAGKTTLMRLITKLSPLSNGQIVVLGDNLRTTSRPLQHTGSLIESPALFDKLSVKDNVKVAAIQHGINDAKDIDEIIELVGLDAKQKTKAKDLSLGQKQRLGIALALLPHPDFLILDEPINGLDPSGIINIRNLIKKLNEEMNTTLLISSHILTELYHVSTRFGFISHGRIIKEISKEELELENKSGVSIEVDDVKIAAKLLDEITTENFVITDEHHILITDLNADTAMINSHLIKNGVNVSSIDKKESSLEQYYVELLAGKGGTQNV